MKNKGLRTCLVIGISLVVLVFVFAAGAGAGYFIPRMLGQPVPVVERVDCPPCTETESVPSEE